MMTNPDMIFSTDHRHGLVARSGWEKEEARTVLRDLGWEWAEELHALVRRPRCHRSMPRFKRWQNYICTATAPDTRWNLTARCG